MRKTHGLAARLPLALLLLALAPAATALAQGTPFQLTLHNVRVERQRESGGDRPYFVTILFQSRLARRGTTRVEVVEREPHDWVSKPEYRRAGRVAAGRDHLFNGESLPIPAWMGELRWEPVEVLEVEAVRRGEMPHVFGAIVLGLDNNNTPPHAVRNIAEQIGTWLRRYLQEQVEGARILGAIDLRSGSVSRDAVQRGFMDFARRMFEEMDKARIVDAAFQTTVGSAFNPDKLVGVHAMIFPAVRGIAPNETAGAFSAPVIGEQVNYSLVVATPEALSRPLVFEGSGARYTVSTRLTGAALAAEATVSSLSVRIATGGDDLRRGSAARAFVTLRDGRRGPATELNRRANWPNHSENTASVALPRGARLADLDTLTITFEPGSSGPFDTGDNWDVEAVTVTLAGGAGVVKVARGRPLVRFTGDRRTFSIPLR